ncbi:MAG: polyisoprenoid-binding protein [Deltaproteobacteria bacterium]|nr:polyisoprenoid-binding protein [Deltaproteobacteria bacterium]MBI3389908.1 polyisoprenoid-binding protein [Deltaproteobacteria bacterium]
MQRAVLVAIVIAGVVASAGARAATFDIDPAHTNAEFAVRHLMVSTVRGHLGKVSGAVQLDETDVTKSSVTATIDVTGIETREPKRDEHLRGADFLDVKQYPTITFKSKEVTKLADDTFIVKGDLTIRGVTKEVTLDVEGSPKPFTDPFGNVKLGGVARTKINRQDFGVAWSKSLDNGGLVVGNELEITIDIELTKKKDEAK